MICQASGTLEARRGPVRHVKGCQWMRISDAEATDDTARISKRRVDDVVIVQRGGCAATMGRPGERTTWWGVDRCLVVQYQTTIALRANRAMRRFDVKVLATQVTGGCFDIEVLFTRQD